MPFPLSVTFPFDHVHLPDEYMTMAAVHECAKAAEDAGFNSGTVTDHPVPSYRWLDNGGHYAQDPFVMLSMVAAVTTRLKLQTNIIVLPYRNPFITARAVSSLDHFSNGRVMLGMGAGPGADAQYLFAEDVLGCTDGHKPRHAKTYRNFAAEYARLQEERVKAFKEFAMDVNSGGYPQQRHNVAIADTEFDEFRAELGL